MNCEDVRTKLIDYYEGELDKKEQNLMEIHLRGCGRCLVELDQVIHTLELVLPSFSVPELPEVFWSQFTVNVMNSIRKEKEKSPVPFQRFRLPRIEFGFANVALAALLLLVLGFLGYRGYIDFFKDRHLTEKVAQKQEVQVQKPEVNVLVKMLQEDPQSDENVLNSILDGMTLDKVEDIIDYELVLLEMNSVFDMSDVDGTEAYVESLLKNLDEKEKEILLSKLHNMI